MKYIAFVLMIYLLIPQVSWADGEKFQIHIADNIEHGTVTVDKTEAQKDETVTVTFTPDEGYGLKKAWYTYISSNDEYIYKFIVSGNTDSFDVCGETTIHATFAEYVNEELTDNTTTTLSVGTYTVNSDITFDHTITLEGEVTLNIAEGATMTINAGNATGIDGDEGTGSLTVSGEGTLIVTTTGSRAVDSILSYTQTGGNVDLTGDYIGLRTEGIITISGGTLNATGTTSSGISAGSLGNLTISGGNVNATGEYFGLSAENIITISGGTVTAKATGTSGAAYDIKGNEGVIITGGNVTVSPGTARALSGVMPAPETLTV